MRTTQYQRLMEFLDSYIYQGEEQVFDMSPDEIRRELVETGTRDFDDVGNDELCTAIEGWQGRQ